MPVFTFCKTTFFLVGKCSVTKIRTLLYCCWFMDEKTLTAIIIRANNNYQKQGLWLFFSFPRFLRFVSRFFMRSRPMKPGILRCLTLSTKQIRILHYFHDFFLSWKHDWIGWGRKGARELRSNVSWVAMKAIWQNEANLLLSQNCVLYLESGAGTEFDLPNNVQVSKFHAIFILRIRLFFVL